MISKECRHNQEREIPLPIDLRVMVHAKTRKRELADNMQEKLCCSEVFHDRAPSIVFYTWRGGGGGGDFNPSCQGSYGQNMPLWHGQHSGKVTVLQNAKRPTALATT